MFVVRNEKSTLNKYFLEKKMDILNIFNLTKNLIRSIDVYFSQKIIYIFKPFCYIVIFLIQILILFNFHI